jgi:hypothetical protein
MLTESRRKCEGVVKYRPMNKNPEIFGGDYIFMRPKERQIWLAIKFATTPKELPAGTYFMELLEKLQTLGANTTELRILKELIDGLRHLIADKYAFEQVDQVLMNLEDNSDLREQEEAIWEAVDFQEKVLTYRILFLLNKYDLEESSDVKKH